MKHLLLIAALAPSIVLADPISDVLNGMLQYQQMQDQQEDLSRQLQRNEDFMRQHQTESQLHRSHTPQPRQPMYRGQSGKMIHQHD